LARRRVLVLGDSIGVLQEMEAVWRMERSGVGEGSGGVW
jgi:hypothetical protein